jgi:hypothetical protein
MNCVSSRFMVRNPVLRRARPALHRLQRPAPDWLSARVWRWGGRTRASRQNPVPFTAPRSFVVLRTERGSLPSDTAPRYGRLNTDLSVGRYVPVGMSLCQVLRPQPDVKSGVSTAGLDKFSHTGWGNQNPCSRGSKLSEVSFSPQVDPQFSPTDPGVAHRFSPELSTGLFAVEN